MSSPGSPTATGPAPHFMIVGSPRSGTTLVQRLASELPAVRVTPETHFYSLFHPDHLASLRFPLPAAAVRGLMDRFHAMPALRGTELDVDRVLDVLDGDCPGPHALFGAVVAALAPEAGLVGEKTPDHLRWWRPISVAAPHTRFIAVLRDPRAVVASTLGMDFGMSAASLIAAGWVRDVQEIDAALTALPSDRILVVRYEDVVARPDAVRARIGALLGVDGPVVPIGSQDVHLFPLEEGGWKQQALGRVDADRASAWRDVLSDHQVRQVEAVAGRAMRRHGYVAEHRRQMRGITLFTPAEVGRLARHGLHRRSERRRIRATGVGPVVSSTRSKERAR